MSVFGREYLQDNLLGRGRETKQTCAHHDKYMLNVQNYQVTSLKLGVGVFGRIATDSEHTLFMHDAVTGCTTAINQFMKFIPTKIFRDQSLNLLLQSEAFRKHRNYIEVTVCNSTDLVTCDLAQNL